VSERTIDHVLSEVAVAIATKGVGKTGRNQQQGYSFRPIDEILNTVGPIMAKAGVVVTAEFRDRTCERVQTQKGGVLNFVTVTGEFFYRWNGQSRSTVTIGEAMDSGDKATNKAMAMATKYAHITTFSIPLIASDDPDLKAHVMGNGNEESRLDGFEKALSGGSDDPSASTPAVDPKKEDGNPSNQTSTGSGGRGLPMWNSGSPHQTKVARIPLTDLTGETRFFASVSGWRQAMIELGKHAGIANEGKIWDANNETFVKLFQAAKNDANKEHLTALQDHFKAGHEAARLEQGAGA
jgi:hypothetical protein